MIRFESREYGEMKQVAESAYPHECCGVMVGWLQGEERNVSELRVAENRRIDSLKNRYLIDPEFYRSLEEELRGSGKSILGFFHSHPDVAARPSEYDRDHAWPWFSYVIVSVREGVAVDVLSWRLSEDRSELGAEELVVQKEANRSEDTGCQ